MKYEFELTLVVRTKHEMESATFETQSIDTVKATEMVSLMGQFLIVIANIHRRILNDFKTERRIFDDDIPF